MRRLEEDKSQLVETKTNLERCVEEMMARVEVCGLYGLLVSRTELLSVRTCAQHVFRFMPCAFLLYLMSTISGLDGGEDDRPAWARRLGEN